VALKDLASLGEVVWTFKTVDQSSSAYSHGLDTNITFSGFDWYGFYGGDSSSMIFRYAITVGGKSISSDYYSVEVTKITTGSTQTKDYISASASIENCSVSCKTFTTDTTYESSGVTYPIFGASYPGIVWAKI
jgi:hypothetical protein